MNKELLYKFFNGETTETEENKIRRWEEEDKRNLEILIKERSFFDSLILFSERKKQNKKGFAEYFLYSKRIRETLKIAAVIIFTISLTLTFNNILKEEKRTMQTFSVPAGQRINLELEDGTKIWLNSCASIKYPTCFSGKTRTVELSGEAYFEVAHNPEKPFIVKTFKGDIEVLGTKFNVLATKKENQFITSLMQGSIKIRNEKNSIEIKPNQMVEMRDDELFVSVIKDYDPYKWREGIVSFKNEPFEKIIRKMEICYGVKIQIENKKLLNHRYSGKLRTSDGVFYALRILQRDLKFSVSRDDNTIYVK